MWKRFTGIATVLITLSLVTAACSSAVTADDDHVAEEVDHEETSSEVDRVVEVELTEFDIAADSFVFTPGETVEFVVTNSGVVQHEFRLSNSDRVEEHLAGGHDDEAEHSDEAEDVALVLTAGESGTLVFTFPENDHDYTAIVCLLPGHYEAGMATDLSY